MAQKTYFFSGTCKWAKLQQPDTKFGEKYTIDVYLDPASMELFEKSGSRIKVRQDEDGTFVKFVRPRWGKNKEGKELDFGSPDVLSSDGKTPFDKLVGNGSKVTCKVEIYTSRYGDGTRLAAVRVDEHVPFEGNQVVGEELF